MKPLPQIRLRTIFLLFFCAAVGLATSTSPPSKVDPSLVGIVDVPQLNWHYGLLSAASVAMVIGLVQQIRQLARLRLRDGSEHNDFAFAARYGIVWRAIIALTIFACLLLRLFVCRQFFELPEHHDLFWHEIIPEQLWLFCVVVVLSDSIGRWRRAPARNRSLPGQTAAAWLFGTFLLFILLPDAGKIWFLVYIAMSNIEAAQPGALHRIGSYPDQHSEGFRLFWICLAAVGVVVVAAVTLTSLDREVTRKRRALRIAGFLFLLLTAAAFGAWYHCIELSRISPDMAEAGFPGGWLDWLGASLIAVFAISIGACRQARGEGTLKVVEYPANLHEQNCLHETFACQLLLVAAAVFYLGEMFREYFAPGRVGRLTLGEILLYSVQDPTSILCIAIGLLSLRSVWMYWLRRNETVVWKLHELGSHRFAWNWLGIAALVVVGLPVISAYCFAFWLGPWYLYGP